MGYKPRKQRGGKESTYAGNALCMLDNPKVAKST